jgi:hypothetical protein
MGAIALKEGAMTILRYLVTTTAAAAISLCLAPVSADALVGPGSKSPPATSDVVYVQGGGQQNGEQSGQPQSQPSKKKSRKRSSNPNQMQKQVDQYKKYVPQQFQQYMPGGGGSPGY